MILMANELCVEPVTRLEGHGELRVKFAADNKTVEDVHFNITSTRFFEKLLEGRPMEHVSRIATRICGICPVPHHVAALKAEEDAWGVQIPPTAEKLRRLLLAGKQMNSHALHFFALAAPDLIYGPFAEPSKRNLVEILKDLPDVGKIALQMLDFGDDVCNIIGGKSVHPIAGVCGGMRKQLTSIERDGLLSRIPDQRAFYKQVYDLAMQIFEKYDDFITNFAVTPTYYMGTAKNGIHDIYDGDLVISTPDGKKQAYKVQDYRKIIGEKVMPHTFTGHTYFKEVGYPTGIFRTNTLANLNCCDQMATPWANEALQVLRKKFGTNTIHQTFAFHWARIIELIAALEETEKLLKDPGILSSDIKTLEVSPRAGIGVGMVDAPRGNLIYELESDKEGMVKSANILVSTNNNVAGIEKSVKVGAQQIWEQDVLKKISLPAPIVPNAQSSEIKPQALGNLLEMIVRCYDCCLSCSAHLTLVNSKDELLFQRPLALDME
jgi:F420-non-reducing hydrogenase large subunit